MIENQTKLFNQKRTDLYDVKPGWLKKLARLPGEH